MPEIPLKMGLGSSQGETNHEGGGVLINAYSEISAGASKSQTVIRASEGRKLFSTVSQTGPCRALFENDGILYGVIGRVVAQFTANGTATTLGGLPSDGHVTFAANGSQIAITGGGTSGIIEGGTLDQIDDADLPPAIDVCSIDNYFVWTIEDGRVFSSALGDGTDINALHFSSAEISPDKNVRGLNRGRELIVFGERSMQPFANDGGTEFPFSPIGGADNSVGCGAPASALVLNSAQSDTLVWVDNNGIVKATPAYDGQRISTHSVERAIENDPEWKSITATTYTRAGHVFYVISGSNFTKVYDFATGEWHDRITDGSSRWNGSFIARFNDKHIVGDAVNGSLYELDPDTKTDADKHLIMTVQPAQIHNYPNRLRVNTIRVDALPGQGLNSTDDHNADPMLMLEMSKDGGNTWGGARHIPMGKIGERKTRIRETQFGSTTEDGFNVRFSVSAAICRGFVNNGSVNVDLLAP